MTRDHELLAERQRDAVLRKTPSTVCGVRLTGLLSVNPLASLWEGWSIESGGHVFVRLLDPQWHDDAAMMRRFEAGAQQPQATLHRSPRPAIIIDADGTALAELAQDAAPPEPAWVAHAVARTFMQLQLLHDQGRVHGGPLDALVRYRGGHRWTVAWGDPFDATSSPADDVQAMAAALEQIDPEAWTSAGALVREWSLDPAPTAGDALALLQKALANDLVAARHQLVLTARNATQRSRVARLARLVRQLRHSVPPPKLRICVRADEEPVMVMLESDGVVVNGGAASSTHSRFLPPLWTPQAGLDAPATRALLRAWALRRRGDEERRRRIDDELGVDDHDGLPLIRWLSAMARLRAARLLLDARRGPRMVSGS